MKRFLRFSFIFHHRKHDMNKLNIIKRKFADKLWSGHKRA